MERPPETPASTRRPAARDPATEQPSIGDLLGRVARSLHVGARAGLAPLGLTPSAARALAALARAGGPLRMIDVADRLRIVPRSATALVDDLEREGFVTRRPDPDDRRSTRVELTATGSERVVELRRARGAAADELLSALSDADRSELRRILELLDEAAGDAWCRRRPPSGPPAG